MVEDIVDKVGLGGDFEEKKLDHRIARETALGGSGLETTSGLCACLCTLLGVEADNGILGDALGRGECPGGRFALPSSAIY